MLKYQYHTLGRNQERPACPTPAIREEKLIFDYNEQCAIATIFLLAALNSQRSQALSFPDVTVDIN